MKIGSQKQTQAGCPVSQVLSRKSERGDKLLEIAFVPCASQLDQSLVILVQQKAISRAVNAELMERRAHLRGKSEIRRGAIFLGDDHPELIDDLLLAFSPQGGAHETVRNHLRKISSQKLRNSRNTVTDNVV